MPRNRAGNVISSERAIANVLANGAKLNGKFALITGATSGVGLESAVQLARNGVFVTVGARSLSKAAEAFSGLPADVRARIDVLECDLQSFASTRRFAEAYVATGRPLNILMLNAGLAAFKHELTEDGWESTFQTCHLSHFLVFSLLLCAVALHTAGGADARAHMHGHQTTAHRVGACTRRRRELQRAQIRGRLGLARVARAQGLWL